MQPALLTWKLAPTQRRSSKWTFSTYNGETFVRAYDPLQARDMAAWRFRKNCRALTRLLRARSPWYVPALVECSCVEHQPFDAIADPGVVYPPDDGAPFLAPATDRKRKAERDQRNSDPAAGVNRDQLQLSAALTRLLKGRGVTDSEQAFKLGRTPGPGHWLHVVMPHEHARLPLGEELNRIIGRGFAEVPVWILDDDEVRSLIGALDYQTH